MNTKIAKILAVLFCLVSTVTHAAGIIPQVPVIKTTSISNNAGNIILSATASNNVAFYFQWRLNGTSIPGATGNCNAGQTNITYTISNATTFNSGNYQVIVANFSLSAISPVFPVTVPGLPPPVTTNINFASSYTFDPTSLGVASSNSPSSVAPADGPAKIAGKPAGGFLWFNWTASSPGTIAVTTRGSSFDTLLGVYTGNSLSNLTSVAEDDDSGGFFTSLVTFNCDSGVTYDIVVAGYQGQTGTVALQLSPGPPFLAGPAGGFRVGPPVPVITQQPINQIVHAGDTVTNIVASTNATAYQWFFAGGPLAGATVSDLVITNFQTNSVGNYYAVLINSFGSNQSDVVALEIATQSNNGAFTTPTNLLVDKFGDAVNLSDIATPARYRPFSGGDIGAFSLSQSFSTIGATKEAGEPNHAGQPGGASYWYSYTAPSSGTLEFDTAGSTFNTILAVYTGSGASFSTLTSVGAAFSTNYLTQGQPIVTISNVVSGTEFFIAIDGFLGAAGAAHLNVNFVPPPIAVNTNAVPITNNSPVVTISSPVNNSVTTSSNITVRGLVRSSRGDAPVTSVQVSINNGASGPALLESSTWLTNVTLVPGANIITAQAITAVDSNTEFASIPAISTVFYDASAPSPAIKAPVTLLASPSSHGKITGQADQAELEIGKVYSVTAHPIGNWLFTHWSSGTNTNSLTALPGGASLAFDMSSNLILQANFVADPFIALAGAYNGLFAPTNGVSRENSGFLAAIVPANAHGAYSAKLLLDGGTYPFTGTFDTSGNASKTVSRAGKTSVSVTLHLDVTGTNDQLTGSLSEVAASGWTATLLAYHAPFNAKSNPATNFAGKYTLIILPATNASTNQPGGYGYATIANTAAGAVSIGGTLADSATFSQSVTVSKEGNIPLYASLYSRKGLFWGWLTLTNIPVGGPAQTITGSNLAWIKTNIAKTAYPAGFTNTNVTALGSHYVPPVGRANDLSLTSATLTVSNSEMGAPLIYSNLGILGTKLTNATAAGNPTNRLEAAIIPSSGILSVTFRPTGSHSDIVAKGVVLQSTNSHATNGAGWFLDGGQSGLFLLQQ